MKKLIIVLAFSLSACANVGPTKVAVDDQLAYAYGAVTGLRNLAAARLQTHEISAEEGLAVQNLATQVRGILGDAKLALYSNQTTVLTKIDNALILITQLQGLAHYGAQLKATNSGLTEAVEALTEVTQAEALVQNVLDIAHSQHAKLTMDDFAVIEKADDVANSNLAAKLAK